MRSGTSIALATWLLAVSAHAQAPGLEFLDVPARPRASASAPSEDTVHGLRELEGELARFGQRVVDYRGTVDELLSRRARERRRAILARYAGSVAREQAEEGRSRRTAIRDLELFVRRHPSEPRHTPSALLRLAELYVERAYEAPGDTLELAPTIEVTQRVVRDFAASPHRERAAYLLGWALAQRGDDREGVAVWRSVVCPDLYAYPEGTAPEPDPPLAPDVEEPPAHPALFSPDAPRRARDPYAGCRPSASPLAAEIWLRIGEAHFDAAELTLAVGAYRRVVEHPEDRLYPFGLYKLAWSEYRSSHYADAIEHFSQLVQRSDDELRRTGHAGSDLREEALQYIALTLAHEDWDEDGRPDHTTGGPHPLERLEDGGLWPRDRAWSPEVYRRVGQVLFEQAHPDEAIVAWRLRLTGYPAACDTPDVYLSIVRAARQLGDEEAALATLEQLASTVTDDEGWRSRACPGRGARADALARATLVSTARIRHRRAQRLRERSAVDGDAATERAARAEYALAVEGYRSFLAHYPNGEGAYELGFDLADALFWSGRYAEAARAYAEVRDSPLDGRHRAGAARRVVESERRAVEGGEPALPEEPAARPEPVPEALQRIARAREIYVRWIAPEDDEEHVRDAYAFNNALLVARYGYADAARRRFEALFRARCVGPRASSVGRDAFAALLDDAVRADDAARIQRLARELRERRCAFSPGGPPVLEQGDCGDDPACIATTLPTLETSAQLRELRERADALRAQPDAPDRAARAARIAAALVATVDRNRAHHDAPAALLLAASLLDQEGGRGEAAMRVYRRVVDEVTDDPDPAHDEVVAEAHFQLAEAAARSFDYDRALASYATIADSRRFAASPSTTMRQRRRDALVSIAQWTTRLGRHADAARAWTRAAELLPAGEAREARLRAAEATLDAGDARGAGQALDAWLREGPGGVRAWALRARAAEGAGDERRRVDGWTRALAAYRASPRPQDLETAGRAALAIADALRDGLPSSAIAPGRQPSVEAYLAELGRQVSAESARARPALDGYEAAIELGHAETRILALHRQGRLYEATVRAVLAARFELPTDVTRQLRRASPAAREEVRARLQDRLRDVLDERVRPVECAAVERYVLAARLARRTSLPVPEAAAARARLAAYGDERVVECVAAAHARDTTFAQYTPGELDPVRPGRYATPPSPVAPSGLAE